MISRSRQLSHMILVLATDIVRYIPISVSLAFVLTTNICRFIGILLLVGLFYCITSLFDERIESDFEGLHHEWLATNYSLFELGYHQWLSREYNSPVLEVIFKKGVHIKCMQIYTIENVDDVIVVHGIIELGKPNSDLTQQERLHLSVRSYYTTFGNNYQHNITRVTEIESRKTYSPILSTSEPLDCNTRNSKTWPYMSANYVMTDFNEAQNSLHHSQNPQVPYKTIQEKNETKKVRPSKNAFGDLIYKLLKNRFN